MKKHWHVQQLRSSKEKEQKPQRRKELRRKKGKKEWKGKRKWENEGRMERTYDTIWAKKKGFNKGIHTINQKKPLKRHKQKTVCQRLSFSKLTICIKWNSSLPQPSFCQELEQAHWAVLRSTFRSLVPRASLGSDSCLATALLRPPTQSPCNWNTNLWMIRITTHFTKSDQSLSQMTIYCRMLANFFHDVFHLFTRKSKFT